MGIRALWLEDVLISLSAVGIALDFVESEGFDLLCFRHRNLILNLIPTHNGYNPADLVAIQDRYKSAGTDLFHLWEDIWQSRKAQVVGRLMSLLGMNKTIHGRKTSVIKITRNEADLFLNLHHLQACANAKYRFALSIDDKIVAVACFSNLRYMKKGGPVYRSAELIRFASLTGYTITGGFSKLLKHFIEQYKPDDIMSYADRDWSVGKTYENSGFIKLPVTEPAEIWLDINTMTRYFTHRLPKEAASTALPSDNGVESQQKYVRIFNTGNLKYVLYL